MSLICVMGATLSADYTVLLRDDKIEVSDTVWRAAAAIPLITATVKYFLITRQNATHSAM